MKIVKKKTDIIDFLVKIQKKRQKIGLIPTMGSIHSGHLSLIQRCNELGYCSLVTIFINPTQFNNLSDFNMYPRDSHNDQKNLEKIGTDLLFYPKIEDLYPEGVKSEKTIFEYRNILCDIYRPGHFDGVTTVVNSLFKLIRPDHIFFGEKDFQQLKIIQNIINNNQSSIKMHSCPSIRMPNGMSYSSRYKKFSSSEEDIFNDAADILTKYIQELKKSINANIVENLRYELKEKFIEKIDYLEIRDDIKLLQTKNIHRARLFIAFYINKIRIIDNFILY